MSMQIEHILLAYARTVRIEGTTIFDFRGKPNRVQHHLENKQTIFKYQTELAKLSNTKI